MHDKINLVDSSGRQAFSAQNMGQSNLLDSTSSTRWKIGKARVRYQRNDCHTLSLYLHGGETSYKCGQSGSRGGPGKFCQMPQGQESNWNINGEIEFAHLYFTDKVLKKFAAVHFDCDVRFIELRPLTYAEDAELQNLFMVYQALASGGHQSSCLLVEQALYAIFCHLLSRYNAFGLQTSAVRGGLSSTHRRKVKAAIHDLLSDSLSVQYLAALVNLSPFHFIRMFKLSFGEPPAQYINRVRVEKTKQLLKTQVPLAQISGLTGFSHQSHMTHIFKKLTSTTPSSFRGPLFHS